jgi:CheY-like chemotaxis protein
MERKKILITDDDADERRLIKLLLREFNFEIIEAEDGEEGVNLALSTHPDLIIMDHRMPKMTGYEAIKKIQTNEKLRGVPIIMMTAQKFDPQMKEMIKMDVVEYIPKPFDRMVFLEAIQKIFGRTSANKTHKKILFATKSVGIRVMKTRLGDNYELEEANAIEEIFEKIETVKPSLIVCNMQFLGWGGPAEGRKLLSHIIISRIPLIMEIFHESENGVDASLLQTAELLSVRSFSVEDLLESIERIVK